MKITDIRDLKYITATNSHIDLFATCAEYGEIPMTLNLVDTEDLHIFVDKDGKEYPLEEYCKTLEIAPYVKTEVVVVIPTSITMRQARLQLLEVGLLDKVEAFISQDRKWQIEWEYANEVYRESPLITALKDLLKQTDEQIDDIFIEASRL